MNKQLAKKFCVLLLALCLILSCTACGARGVTFAEYFKDYKYEEPFPAFNAMEKIDAFTGMHLEDYYRELIVFSSENTFTVYNTETAAVIAELDGSWYSDVEFFAVGDNTFFLATKGSKAVTAAPEDSEAPTALVMTPEEMEQRFAQGLIFFEEESGMFYDEETGEAWVYDPENNCYVVLGFEPGELEPEAPVEEPVPMRTYVTEVYNAQGNKVASADGSAAEFPVREDLFEIGGAIYRVAETGEVTRINVNPFFGSLPEIDAKVGDHYYTTDGDSVTVYDSELNASFYWEVPYDCEYEIMPIGDNILVQMFTPLFESEDDYDLVDEETKYDITSLIINPVKGDVKNV